MILRVRPVALTVTALTLCAITGTQAYVLNGPRWATNQVPYYINPANLDVSANAAEAAVQAGLATWGSQSNANFSFYYMGRTTGTTMANNGKNEIFFRNASAGSMTAETHWWYDSNNHLVDADIVFYDGGFKFFTGSSGCSGGVYIEDVAAHESGHALGLGHSSVTTATMYPSMGWCSTSQRSLDSDDLAGVEKLYPPSSGSTSTTTNSSPTVSISSPANNSSFAAGTAIKFTGSASDRQDGSLSARIVWTSSLTGSLGIGASISVALTSGTHTITAKVTDSAGATAAAKIVVNVASPTTSTQTSTSFVTGPRTGLMWQNASTGGLAEWEIEGTRQVSGSTLTPAAVADTKWKIVTTGDFDRDGQRDLVWQHTDGTISVWLMRGTILAAGLLFEPSTVGNPDWRVVAAADMNRDGMCDLVWRNRATGALAVWYMDGTRRLNGVSISPGTVSDINWEIVAAADFDGDAQVDLLWRHKTQGWLSVWLMNGVTMREGRSLVPGVVADTGWTVRAVNDITGDRKPDIIWEHTDGRLAAWIMNGLAMTTGTLLTPDRVLDSNWRIVGPR
jgi:hypothetical protein